MHVVIGSKQAVKGQLAAAAATTGNSAGWMYRETPSYYGAGQPASQQLDLTTTANNHCCCLREVLGASLAGFLPHVEVLAAINNKLVILLNVGG